MKSTKTNRIDGEKQLYVSPIIEQIELDNEISLQLQSSPPVGPGEEIGYLNATHCFNNDPFKMT